MNTTLALTPALSPGEREQPALAGFRDLQATAFIRWFKNRRTVRPLLGERAGVRAVVKPCLGIFCATAICWQAALSAHAQSYSIDWYKIAGGGGTSTNGQYSVSGTIGQSDAGGAMSGGNYSLTGGFWALISMVQTAGLPDLTIAHSGNSVIISWPDTGRYTLWQSSNLAAGSWTASGYSITTANGTNSVTLMAPGGKLFFRLTNP